MPTLFCPFCSRPNFPTTSAAARGVTCRHCAKEFAEGEAARPIVIVRLPGLVRLALWMLVVTLAGTWAWVAYAALSAFLRAWWAAQQGAY